MQYQIPQPQVPLKALSGGLSLTPSDSVSTSDADVLTVTKFLADSVSPTDASTRPLIRKNLTDSIVGLDRKIPSFVASASAGINDLSSSMTISTPSGAQAGDVLLAELSIRKNVLTDVTSPGWTFVRKDARGSGWVFLLARVVVTGEPASHLFSFVLSSGTTVDASAGVIMAFRDVDPDLSVIQAGSPSNSNLVAGVGASAGMSPLNAAPSLVIKTFNEANSNSSVLSSTWPTSTEIVDFSYVSPNPVSLGIHAAVSTFLTTGTVPTENVTIANGATATYLSQAIGLLGAPAVVKTVGRSPSDSVTGSDAKTVTETHPSADSVTPTDAVSKSVIHPVADSVTTSDAAIRTSPLARTDSVTISDAKSLAFLKILADGTAASDLADVTGAEGDIIFNSPTFTQNQIFTTTTSQTNATTTGGRHYTRTRKRVVQ